VGLKGGCGRDGVVVWGGVWWWRWKEAALCVLGL